MTSQRSVTGIPPILVINANTDRGPAKKHFWTARGWLPREIGVTVDSGNVTCQEGEQLDRFRDHPSTSVYELVGVVANATSGRGEQLKEHLISFIDGRNALTHSFPCLY